MDGLKKSSRHEEKEEEEKEAKDESEKCAQNITSTHLFIASFVLF